ncbi:transposase [Tengunoibacter tsumagoiensis]|uniref:Transposase n=1 Tax=Tengunoibacter tsumagoiensis TaxID=2014871 RepID=A0A401ZU51_9CHLR|nr:transposase [Tengunoibacter tsumagoiensis]GCE10300.1 hypothetical protein KTT_01590 [Tengunoibacter tsumagoiensis]
MRVKDKPGRVKQHPTCNLLDRFSQQRQAVLRPLYNFTVPFANNQTERNLHLDHAQITLSLVASA